MEYKEEVHSDDGSYDLIDFDDYASDPDHLDMKIDVSSNMDQSDDGSYDFLSSEMSDILVLNQGEDFNGTNVLEDNLCQEMEAFVFESDPMEQEEEEEGFSDMDFPDSIHTGKKRNFMTMAYENSTFDVFNLPTHIKLKSDMKIRDVMKNHILRYLPAKALARSRLVSKEWNEWIPSPFFAHTQSQYFTKISGFFQDQNGLTRFISLDESAYGVPDPSLCFLPNKVSIKSSCNGLLLCQATDDENEYYVCNPANKEWVELPGSNYYHGRNPKIVIGFEPSSLNFDPCYHVISPFSLPGLDGSIVYFDIYDSKTKKWKISDMICVDLDKSDMKSDGIFVNGVVYWETTGGKLLAFDLKNEIYGVQTIPFGESGAVSKVGGELCYVTARYHYKTKTCVLDFYNGSVLSLKYTLSFDVIIDGIEDGEFVECQVLASSCDDVVGVVVKTYYGPECLYVYRVKDREVDGPMVLWGSGTFNLFPYVNSLVSVAI